MPQRPTFDLPFVGSEHVNQAMRELISEYLFTTNRGIKVWRERNEVRIHIPDALPSKHTWFELKDDDGSVTPKVGREMKDRTASERLVVLIGLLTCTNRHKSLYYFRDYGVVICFAHDRLL